MAIDIHAPEAVTATTHRHPFIEERHVAQARKRVVARDRDALGSPVVLSLDPWLPCCARMVSTLTPGEPVANA